MSYDNTRDIMVNEWSHKRDEKQYYEEMREITDDKEIPYTGTFPWESAIWSRYEVAYYFIDNDIPLF